MFYEQPTAIGCPKRMKIETIIERDSVFPLNVPTWCSDSKKMQLNGICEGNVLVSIEIRSDFAEKPVYVANFGDEQCDEHCSLDIGALFLFGW